MTVGDFSDREGRAAIFAQATTVYIFFINDRLKVAPHVGLANLPAIEEYPTSEESKRVAVSVRSAAAFLLSQDIPTSWRNSFWNQDARLERARRIDGDRLRSYGRILAGHPRLCRNTSPLKYMIDGRRGQKDMRSAISMRLCVGCWRARLPSQPSGVEPTNLERPVSATFPEAHGRELHNDRLDSAIT